MATVAVIGDVTATPCASHPVFLVGGSGLWTAGAIEYSSYAKLRIDGREAIWQAKCQFSFEGATATGAPVKDLETVTLTATTKLLNQDQHSVLVDNDSTTGTKGNALRVSATGPLLTSVGV